MAKVLIWLASGDIEKLKPGILYGVNAKKYNWLEDVKFVIFGESEKLLLNNPEYFQLLQEKAETTYCKFVSNEMDITDQLIEKGANVIFVGDFISKLIEEGYQVITF